LLDLAHEYDIDLEGEICNSFFERAYPTCNELTRWGCMTGACEGSVACSTCHVILDPDSYDLLEEPEDDENDMLDMAFGLTETSRLGCQVKMKRELDGLTATLPAATRNMFVDGAKPTKH